jgi:hypothetical protein
MDYFKADKADKVEDDRRISLGRGRSISHKSTYDKENVNNSRP